MTMPSDADIVRRLAEHEGWIDLHEQTNGLFVGISPKHVGSYVVIDVLSPVPDYLTDVAAALRVCEKVCLERKKVMDCFFWGDSWVVQIGDDFLCSPEGHETEPTLARAAALAAWGVIGSGEKESAT